MRNFEICEISYNHLKQINWNEKFAVAVSFENMKNDDFMFELGLYCFKSPNNIHEYPLKFLTSKNFPLMLKLNEFIMRARESGLVMKWLNGFKFSPRSDEKPLFEYIEVKVEMFRTVILILGILFFFTYFILILERTSYKKVQMNNVQPIWHLIDNIINPYRIYIFGIYNQIE